MTDTGDCLNIRHPPRTVKPRRLVHSADKPIIAVADGSILVERTGEILPEISLADLTVIEPSSIIVCHNAGDLLRKMDEIFTDNPRWQFRVSPIEREHYEPNREKGPTIRDTIVVFWGFQRSNGHRESVYHYPLDPLAFLHKTAREIVAGSSNNLTALYEWACDIRGFCIDNQLAIKPTSGGIAGQLLRDPRFYPNARRKVPRATNDRARKYLPGNFYRLHTKPNRSHQAIYFDQDKAHHNCAQTVDLPAADSLYARGYYWNEVEHRIWAHPGTSLYERIIRQHGLFRLKVYIPHYPLAFPPPFMEKSGRVYIHIFSNEISTLLELGGRIEGIIAAWTSPHTDSGLARYGQWSIRELSNSSPTRLAWLKPTLLASYGILAARPRKLEFGFKRAKRGIKKRYPVAGTLLTVMTKAGNRTVEMGTANVIHRAMIEAETRKRSLEFARSLAEHKCTVLSVYADSVFIDSDCQLPLTPPGWKVQASLDRLRFFNAVQFTSAQLTKLPGIPEAKVLDYLRRVSSLKSLRKKGTFPLAKE